MGARVATTTARRAYLPDVRPDDVLPIADEAVVVEFGALSLPANSVVQEASLALFPSSRWRTGGGASSLWVRFVGRDGVFDAEPGGSVQLTGLARTPVRIDVTPLVRAAFDRGETTQRLALSVVGSPVAFVGPGSAEVRARPRIEVLYR